MEPVYAAERSENAFHRASGVLRPSFLPGMLYQFRVWSWRERQAGRTFISASEDLKGVFQIKR